MPTTRSSSTTGQRAAAIGFGAAVAAASAIGARVGPSPANPRTARWYDRLEKPPFQPPSSVFAPVWTALYAGIATSGYRVWRCPPSRRRSAALALWGGQLAANAAWSPLFFGARRPRAALADLLTQLGLTAAYTVAAAPLDPVAAGLMVPYLGWTAFAGALNEEVARRDPEVHG